MFFWNFIFVLLFVSHVWPNLEIWIMFQKPIKLFISQFLPIFEGYIFTYCIYIGLAKLSFSDTECQFFITALETSVMVFRPNPFYYLCFCSFVQISVVLHLKLDFVFLAFCLKAWVADAADPSCCFISIFMSSVFPALF